MASFPKIICRVRAIYPFSSKEPASLSFDKDDYIDVLAQLDSGWWDGWCGGSRGWFPSNYVEIVEENPDGPMPPSPAPTSKPNASPPVVDPKRSDLRQPSRRKRSNSTTQHRLSLKTLSNTSSNMSTPVPRRTAAAAAAATSPSPVTSPVMSNGSKFGWTAASNRTSNSTVSDGSVYNLPDGWSAQLAEDGTTRYYYNHRTGKMQYDHPGFGFSDGEYDSEYEASMDDSYYSDEDYEDERYQHSRLATMRRMSNRLSLDSLPANVDTPATAFSDDFKQPPPLQESAAMSHWVQRVTPQGRAYYCNLVTQETTWDYGEIDQATGRLKHRQHDSDSDTDEPIGRTTIHHSRHSSNHAAELSNPSNNGDSTCSSPTTPTRDEPLTWHKLASTTAMAIHHLNMAAQRGERDAFVEDASAVVVSIRMMLYASGMLDKDSSHMQDRMLRDPHRAVMAALSKLVLSVKTASEGSHKQIQPEMLHRVQRDAGDVLAAVRSFVTVCQERRVKVEQVKPQLMFDTKAPTTPPSESPILVSSSTAVEFDPEATRIATGLGQKSKYPLNQDLLVSLQTHANQVYGSTNALCKATELNTNEDGKSLSNVILLFRSLSMQIGQYLSILEDIDLVNIDGSKIPSLGDYLVNKQKLYNAVGVLFGVVQSLSSNRMDTNQCVQNINEAVQSVENTIKLILTNVDEMIKQRRNWYRQLNPGDDDEMPMSPVSARFDDSDSEDGELCKAPTDKARKLMLYQPPVAPRSATENGGGGGCLGYDYPPEEIVYGQDGNIKGGTLRALVERLTLHDSLDTSFIATFLLTYRSFCTTEEFLSLLEQRYNIRPTEELTPWELEEWSERKQKLVRLRVFNVMKIWLENYYNDEDQFILNRLEFFTNTVIRDTSPFSADQLNRLIRMRKDQDANGGLKKLVPNTLPGPMPILPKDITRLTLMEIDPTELARQLTNMDFKLYSSIRPIECLNKAWSQDDEMAASSVKQSIDYCNRLTCWVSDSILSNDEAKKRVVVIKYWAQVASKCRSLNNYNTCMAIISAFDTSSIGRLKKTWELVGSRTSQTLANIRRLMGANRNFQEYRDLIHSINPPCIPFLGIYLQDLTFIEDGNADYIQKSAGLINFAKRAKTAEVIREINQFQNAPYIFTHIPELQAFIKTNLEGSRDVDKLYERSLQIEPREVVTYN